MKILILIFFTFLLASSFVNRDIAPDVFYANRIDTIGNPELDEDSVDVEASFPGGKNAWQKYLVKKLRYPAEAQDNNIQGVVNVKFYVQPDGSLTNIEAIDGPAELQAEAVRIFKISPKWTPAKKNNLPVRSQRTEHISFRLQ